MKQYILWISILFYNGYCESVSDFQGKAFKFTNKQSQIYKVNVGLPEDQMDLGLISSYGDFNGDKAVDVVIVDQKSNNIIILYWDNTLNEFEQKNVCQSSCYPVKDIIIQGTIPLDYDYDGYLDILVVLGNDEGFTINILRQTEIKNGYPVFEVMQEKYSSSSYPFVGDFFGNHKTSIMITTDTQRLVVQYGLQQPTDFLDLVDQGCSIKDYEKTISAQLLNPHFSSFVDVSSDCRADLIITSELGIEYWYTKYVSTVVAESTDQLLNKQPRFCLQIIDSFINGAELKTLDFVDINFDGSIDMIYVFQRNDLQNLVINYNQYENPNNPPNLCQSNTKDSDKQMAYPYSPFSLLGTNTKLVTPLSNGDQPIKLYDYKNLDLSLALAPFLRFGDYLASGYPGAFMIIYNETTYKPNIYYLKNVPISTDCELESRMCRQLIVDNDPGDRFYLITEMEGINVAFFDFGENGRLDFLVNSISMDEDQKPRYNLAAFYNYISLDAFFLKSLGINGQCAADEESKITCQGSLYYGATYQFRVTDISGSYKPAAGIQLYQSAYSPLQLPYSYMGLGRTNNYIENFYLGIPLLDGQIRQWTPIIPNSQLIVSPFTDNTKSWTLSIFIEPTEAILVVVIVTIIILFVLGGIIIWKHIKEKEDDKKNQEQFFQMFR
ncbi:unnamed protein product [Paramecium pentaurelia]|uniref:T-cell immunomodulatory protein TIP C2 domain-containing protein n=1 Tax=Paramecium pentaurelia TaxID=43138 RepID=A0A8S1X7H8_9CILI|nr:unnamed protein product [Paramecium pentaurelia]